MRKHVADAIDWYLNKMNQLHFLPVNLATMVRDISAKQIGGPGFRPRPLTAENFTDAELDAIKALADKAKGNAVNYYSYIRLGNRSLGSRKVGGGDIRSYLSPLNVIRTTFGAFNTNKGGDGQKTVHDIYDFNQNEVRKVFDNKDGTISFRLPGEKNIRTMRVDDFAKTVSRRKRGAYETIRQNAANFGHTDKDPDSEKITVDIPMSDIEKRLGDRAGKYDITAKPTESEFKRMAAGSGAMTGAPVGAVLGALSGAMLLINKKRRKKWLRTMLTSILAGSAIGALTGGVGGWAIANSTVNNFNSNPYNDANVKSGEARANKKKAPFRQKVFDAVLNAIPIVAVAGAGVYGLNALRRFRDRMLDPSQSIYTMRDTPVEFVESLEKL